MEITAHKEIIVLTLGALVVGVCTVLMLPDFWYAVAFARTLAKAVQEWQDSGPHNTLLGRAREHLAAAGWLAAPRDPLVECGLPSGGGWKQLLQLMLHTEASLTCMERQVLLAQEEHLAFRATVLLAVACFTLTVSLLGWTWARHKLVRRSEHRKDDDLFPGGEGEAPSYEDAAAKQSDGAEEASECAGQGQAEAPSYEDAAAKQSDGAEEASECAGQGQAEAPSYEDAAAKQSDGAEEASECAGQGQAEAPSYEDAAAKQSDGAEEASECAGQGQAEAPSYEDAAAKQSDGAEEASECAGQGQAEAPSYEDAAAKQSDGAEEASECAGQGQAEVAGKEEISAQKEDEGVLPPQQEEVIPQQEKQKFHPAQEAAGLEALAEQDEAVPQQEEAVPQQEEAVPQQEEAVPQQEEAVPQQEEAVPQQEEAVPQQEEAVPQQEEAVPQQEEAVPQQEEAVPQQEEAVPQQEEAVPQQEEAGQQVTPLPLPRLRSPDRRDILGRRWLSDDVMDLAQELLQRQFPNTGGLYACGAAFTLPPLQPGNAALFLQVVNRSTPMSLASMADYGRAGGSHWLLLSSYGAGRPGQLAVYDSLYDTLSTSTAALVRQLQELHAPPPGVVVRPVQRQRDGYSCGLFALAFAFSIAHGQDPCRLRYVRARMASHLLSCLERGTVTPFPSEPKGTLG
ncbi:uncharacterized protein LOC126996730 isoform X2 [Eriocheir sinensis]|uniref:uncharacterized protein LOC126996730 isoform X2 n=1 Tax=Eriocheir sinensis TaxID=95602 RepID=UPI0021C6619F|nr:uncharacterized protein LOC126996730 isoform X2 [Eriocheir sinensis]